MDPFLLAMLGSVGFGAFLSGVKSRRIDSIVKLKPQTKAEEFLEHKVLGRFILSEVSEMVESKHVPKEQVSLLLNKLSILCETSRLSRLNQNLIKSIIEAATDALVFIDQVDRKYIFLLKMLVDAVVKAVVLTGGEDESVFQMLKTRNSVAGLGGTFRKYCGSEEEIKQWKDTKTKGGGTK
jgi:hypothetical protein